MQKHQANGMFRSRFDVPDSWTKFASLNFERWPMSFELDSEVGSLTRRR
jgi:hypothetical protein